MNGNPSMWCSIPSVPVHRMDVSGSAPWMQIRAMDADPETSGSWNWQFRTTTVTVYLVQCDGISAMVAGDYAAVVVSRDLAVSCYSGSLGGKLRFPAPEAQAPV